MEDLSHGYFKSSIKYLADWRLKEIKDRAPLPGDLLGTALFAVLTLAFTLLPPLDGLPVRIPLGLAMVLFLPGYALIAALFPRRDDLDGIERTALSFGLSIAVVPLIGLGLNYTPWGIRLVPVVISLAIFTIAMAGAAYFRRSAQPPEGRFSVDLRKNLDGLKAEILADGSSRLDKALTVILIITIILSVSALAYVIVIPKQGEKFTEFYILGPGGKAYDYPTKVDPGNSSTVIVGVVNHEYVLTNYTMRLAFRNETILSRTIRLDHNETWERPVSYMLKDPGHDNKLQFLLYRESNFTAPYRDLHLWINVLPRNETSTVPMVSLPEIQKQIFMGYANIVPKVFNATKMKVSHRHDRQIANAAAVQENLTKVNATLPLPDQNLTNETGPVTSLDRDEVNLTRLMNRSVNVSKVYPKINATLIKPKMELRPNQSLEAPERIEPQANQSQEVPANVSLPPESPANATPENAAPEEIQANNSQEMQGNATPAVMPAILPQDTQGQGQGNATPADAQQSNETIEAPANTTIPEPQLNQTVETPAITEPQNNQSQDVNADAQTTLKPIALGKGPVQKTVVLGRSSAGTRRLG